MIKYFVLFILIVIGDNSSAQYKNNRPKTFVTGYWLEITGNTASSISRNSDNDLFNVGVSFRKGWFVNVGIASHNWYESPGDIFFSSIGDFHLMGGKIWNRKFLTYSIGAGASVIVSQIDTGGIAVVGPINIPEYSRRNTVGLPLEGRLYFTPFRWFGIGILPYANINSVKSYAGTMYGIIIGNIKPRRKP